MEKTRKKDKQEQKLSSTLEKICKHNFHSFIHSYIHLKASLSPPSDKINLSFNQNSSR